MPPAARVADLHLCPLVTPPPHVGGPIIGPGASTVLVGGLPAAIVGDEATCVGAVDSLVTGSATVKIMGVPAVRLGDTTAHGGKVVTGMFTVNIGG